MTTNRKFTSKVNSHCFKLHRSYSISFNLSNVGGIFWVKSKRTVSKFRKRKRNFLCCAHLLHKAGPWNRKFHVAVVQQRLRNVQKSVMHVQSWFFANLNLFFCCSPSPLQKLPIVVIQKFCYHGYGTSHFSCPLKWLISLGFVDWA